MSGDLPEGQDLDVGVSNRHRGSLEQGGDAGGLEAGDHIARIVGEDHQVRPEAQDGLYVGLEAAQVRYRGLDGEGGEGVDRHHLVVGADGEEHLGRHRRDRDDACRTGGLGCGRGT